MTDAGDIRSKKRTMTLDLETGGTRSAKLARGCTPTVLTSPDIHMFKLASPEVEKFIKNGLQANSQQATPMAAYFNTSKNVTAKQEQFVMGFEVALEKLKREDVRPSTCEAPSGAGTTTLTTLTSANLNVHQQMQVGSNSNASTLSSDALSSDTNDSMTIKDEQTVPAMESRPIDMRDQEKLKLERKRHRNRIAASKCRKKKLERIAMLEEQVNKLKGENQDYERMVNTLRGQVAQLRQEVHTHQQQGCQL